MLSHKYSNSTWVLELFRKCNVTLRYLWSTGSCLAGSSSAGQSKFSSKQVLLLIAARGQPSFLLIQILRLFSQHYIFQFSTLLSIIKTSKRWLEESIAVDIILYILELKVQETSTLKPLWQVAKLEQFQEGTLALWVQRVKLWECIYNEILDLITIFAKFCVCMGTP